MDLVNRLSYLFGTEETVKQRKKLVLMREKIWKCHSARTMICSGSLGEGVAYPKSDDDIMCVMGGQSHVYDNYQVAKHRRAFYMIPSEYFPGFCLIQDPNIKGFALLPSKECVERLVESLPGSVPHGPCASDIAPFPGLNEYDYALCLSSPRWPIIAYEWIRRRRRWPPRETIEAIVRNGCHFVPIGNPDSSLCDLEWRVSFSLAERSLIHAFNHVQFLVYNLLKLELKRVMNVQVPDALCSYFLKTVMFYVIERNAHDLWLMSNIDECHRNCLSLLYHFIDTRNCPNYFMPDNNMMSRKINANNKGPLLHIVNELINHGVVGSLHLCNEPAVLLPCLSLEHVEYKLDYEMFHGYLLDTCMRDCVECILRFVGRNVELLSQKLVSTFCSALRNNNSIFLRLLIGHTFTFLGMKYIYMSLGESKRNRSRYVLCKQGEAMLKVGCNTDISSGRLHLSNYLYVLGRTHECMDVINRVLSKYAPYVMFRGHDKDEHMDMYMEAICKKGYTLDVKIRKAWAFHVRFSPHSAVLAPLPIKLIITLTNYILLIHPLVYVHFLHGLCFYHSRDMASVNNSISALEYTVRDLDDEFDVLHGRILLGYMKMLQQDYQLSFHYLFLANLKNNEIYEKYHWKFSDNGRTCVILLAFLLNRILHTR